MKESQYVYANPPSPRQQKFKMPHFQYCQPQQQTDHHNPQIIKIHNPDSVRSSTHLRPHSHNPFSNHVKIEQKVLKHETEQTESRSRAVSASPNIKISFMGTPQQIQKQN